MSKQYRLYITSLTTGKVYEHCITLDKNYAEGWCKEWNESPQGQYLTAQYDTQTQTLNYD